jgi:hypothetical protein
MNEMGVACSIMRERRGVYRILVRKSAGKRPTSRWEDNIKIDLQEVGRRVYWIDLAHDRGSWRALANAVMNLRVP